MKAKMVVKAGLMMSRKGLFVAWSWVADDACFRESLDQRKQDKIATCCSLNADTDGQILR